MNKKKTKRIVVTASWCGCFLAMLVVGAGAAPPSLRDAASTRSEKLAGDGQPGRDGQGECLLNEDCNDDDPCTTDVCADGVCVYVPTPKCEPECDTDADCDDEDPCTENLCIGGLCEHPRIDGCMPPCQSDEDCDDGNGCTEDICSDGVCVYNDIPGCEPCYPNLLCPPLDVVVVMDTSGSMKDEADALCGNIDQLVADLAAEGVVVVPYLLGITVTPDGAFWCLTDNVVNLLGDTVPGDPDGCPFPDGSAPYESWGPATAIVADRFDWTPDSVRVIMPMSDEGACNGSIPEGCNDPGDDRDAVENAITVANANGVIVAPVTGTGSSACVQTLADDLAAGTGGLSFHSQDPHDDLVEGLRSLLLAACETQIQCDDGNACTDDFCDDDGVCQHEPNYDESVYCCNPEDGTLTPIDDGDDCTEDACDPETGEVTHTPLPSGTPCDDGDPCTINDVCDGLGNCTGSEIDCDDDNVCTDDFCDDDGVCQNQPNYDVSVYCCDPVDGTLTLLDDGDPCTDDVCDPETGEVTHPPAENGTPCDDGNACTDDSCQDGGCVGIPNFDESIYCCNPQDGTLTPIDDENDCTDDVCDPLTGEVTHTPTEEGTPCDDGDPCTVDDVCDGEGNCAGTEIDCDDGNACTDDYCEEGECFNTPNYDESLYCCNPADGSLTPLDDGDPCTDDVCDPETGQVTHPPAENGTPCDDGNACTDDSCQDGGCVGTPNFDESIYCCNPDDGSLTPIDDGNVCTDDACDPATGEVIHTPVIDGTFCDDGNACTDDACLAGECVGTPNFDESVYCCDPEDGLLTELDDGDPCTDDVCDPLTGEVTHPPAEEGTPCDDGNNCTIDDICDGDGNCSGTDINIIPCESDEDCYGYECDTETDLCVCREIPTLCLEDIPNPELYEGCHDIGEELIINAELGFGTAVVAGGQLVIQYDPSLLEFVSIAPGSEWDPESPFSFEIFRDIDEEAGIIIYSVGIEFGGEGTQGPATLATIRFTPLEACAETELCFLNENPLNTILTDIYGSIAPYVPGCCTEPLSFDDGGPTLNCPESVEVNPLPGHLSANVIWDPLTFVDGCDTEVSLVCSGHHSHGIDVDHLIEAGGAFPMGLAEFECTATDSCGHTVTCGWHVYVSGMNNLEVEVHLSPTMVDGPLYRCIIFELFSSCVEDPEVVARTLEFGLPFNLPGHAKDVEFKIPAGQYFCMTARDPLHTLRSTADIEIQGDSYMAIFKGDPFFGGNWLIGGNLDGNRVIDVMDFAVFADQELTVLDPDTPCGTEAPHSDINGDGIVDMLDWSFIQLNYLSSDKDACCPGGVASAPPAPITQIPVGRLWQMGLGHLSVADLNRDGRLDYEDINAYMNGVRPSRTKQPTRNRTTRDLD